MRGATSLRGCLEVIVLLFQPTRPLRGATHITLTDNHPLLYFNPRAPCGARLKNSTASRGIVLFQPTRPLRGATGATVARHTLNVISTHAPLAGRDWLCSSWSLGWGYFNPRAPCGARLAATCVTDAGRSYFNPRAPCGARHTDGVTVYSVLYISTHAPLAGRDQVMKLVGSGAEISTHAPLAGRDIRSKRRNTQRRTFQPTRPLRGATRLGVC